MSYSNPLTCTYVLKAVVLTGGATTLFQFKGPAGKKGALVDVSAVSTTAVTVAATNVTVGSVGTTNKYGTLALPVAAIGSAYNGATVAAVDSNVMPANTTVVIATSGAATAGAADVAVTINWF